jgi:hypothetical protein
MTEYVPFLAIGADELKENDYIEPFYICDYCKEKHLIEFIYGEKTYCSKCGEKCKCKGDGIKLGFYKCKGQTYLYSIGDKQV